MTINIDSSMTIGGVTMPLAGLHLVRPPRPWALPRLTPEGWLHLGGRYSHELRLA